LFADELGCVFLSHELLLVLVLLLRRRAEAGLSHHERLTLQKGGKNLISCSRNLQTLNISLRKKKQGNMMMNIRGLGFRV
jgi:hypothetical protein